MTPKTPPSSEVSGERAGLSPVDFAAQWSEARRAYPLYAALATQFNFAPLPHPAGELLPAKPTREIFDRDLAWLDKLDEQLRAYQIRQLPPETLNASEEALRTFIQRQLRKSEKTNFDRDKIDLLLVQYFALCAPEELYRNEIKLDDVARVLQPVLAAADSTPLEWLAPLEEILGKVGDCHSLRDLLELGLLEQGRLLKESAGCMFYDPAALVAFCRFNFLLRRAFIRLLHADVSAVRSAVEALAAAGVKVVDCRRAGFSAAETTDHLRLFCENWRQPFQKDYTESSVTRCFEQLLALRADLDEALARAGSHAAPEPARQVIDAAGTKHPSESAPQRKTEARSEIFSQPPAAPPAKPQLSGAETPPSPARPAAPASSAGTPRPVKPATEVQAPPATPPDADKCLELIWEQLIAAPPSRGRSMSTVVLEDTKVLLSSWEVAAFVVEGGQEAEDLRRAVVARALVALGMESRKRSGNDKPLRDALQLARTEVSYFQGRVEQAKRAKNTEAAVNLGISTKRLLSIIEEAEKLQP
jgi:hypothetical protein